MAEQISKTKVLELIHREHEALLAVLELLTEAQLVESGVENGWSVKDILAHITAWEQKMVQWIEASLSGDVSKLSVPYGMTDDDVNQLNQQFYLANQNKPLPAVQATFAASFQQSLKMVETLTEADLLNPDRFEWREGRPLWYLVAANTWEHYQEHRQSITNWLARPV